MFKKISVVALAIIAPLATALTLDIPSNPTSGGPMVINWTFDNSDPSVFSIELVNEVFHNSFAIANNLPITSQTINILNIPVVPVGGGYSLEAVGVSNITQVLSTTGQFSIGPNGATSVASITGASSTTSNSKTKSSSGSASVSTVTSAVTSLITLSTTTPVSSGFGTTLSASTPATSTAPSSATSSAAAPTTSPNAAVSALKMTGNVGAFAAVLLSAVAGAAIIL